MKKKKYLSPDGFQQGRYSYPNVNGKPGYETRFTLRYNVQDGNSEKCHIITGIALRENTIYLTCNTAQENFTEMFGRIAVYIGENYFYYSTWYRREPKRCKVNIRAIAINPEHAIVEYDI